MRTDFVLATFIALCQSSIYSANNEYTLSSKCLVLFPADGRAVSADRLDIVASVDAEGRNLSPFKITVHDGGAVREFVMGACYARADANASDLHMGHSVVRKEMIGDGFMVGDDHFSISASKVGDMFRVVVDNLDSRRIDAKAEAESARIFADAIAPDAPTWPSTDGDYKYSSSRTDRFPIMALTNGKMVCTGWLRSNGALYQQNGRFMIRFGFSHETTNGVVVARSEGRIVGEITHGEIKNSMTFYDVGQDVAKVQICLPQGNAIERPHRDEMVKTLETHGIKERSVRLSMVYMGYTRNLDLDMHLLVGMARRKE